MKARLNKLKKSIAARRRLRAMRKKNLKPGGITHVRLKELAPEEKLFLGLLAFSLVAVFGATGYGLTWFLSSDAPAKGHASAHAGEGASADHGEAASHDEGGHEGGDAHAESDGHGSEGSFMYDGQRVANEVLEAQDGRPEDDNNLRDPTVTEGRSIASLMKSDLKVSLGSRFVGLGEFMAGSRATPTSDGSEVLAEISLEVSAAETEAEVTHRRVELQSLISGIIGEKTKEQLRSQGGVLELKKEIKREINNVLLKGKIEDVFFSGFLVR